VFDLGSPKYAQNQVPEWLKAFTSTREKALWPSDDWCPSAMRSVTDWLQYPVGIWLGLLFAVVLAAVLRYTVFGRYVFALGSNEATARLCGVNVPLVRIVVYALGGLFVGLAGVYQFSRLSVGNPTGGGGLELRVIAAVVIGGGSLSGGRGSVLGTLAGAALMSVIASGCTQLGVPNPLQDVVLGVVIVAAVTLDQLRSRRFGGT
jgi:ribose/xylose/arabinose/galactoside ABC-type transport system permease subunit